MFSLNRLVTTAALLVAVTAGSAHAQTPVATAASDTSKVTTADSGSRGGPRIAPVGVHRIRDSFENLRAGQPVSMGKPMALMIVGGAAFVLGALIGQDVGTLFMIGGAVSFLIGLYQYIK